MSVNPLGRKQHISVLEFKTKSCKDGLYIFSKKIPFPSFHQFYVKFTKTCLLTLSYVSFTASGNLKQKPVKRPRFFLIIYFKPILGDRTTVWGPRIVCMFNIIYSSKYEWNRTQIWFWTFDKSLTQNSLFI